MRLRDKRTGRVSHTLRVPRGTDPKAAVRTFLAERKVKFGGAALPAPKEAPPVVPKKHHRGSVNPLRAPPVKEYPWWHAEIWVWRLAVVAVVAGVVALGSLGVNYAHRAEVAERAPPPRPADPGPALSIMAQCSLWRFSSFLQPEGWLRRRRLPRLGLLPLWDAGEAGAQRDGPVLPCAPPRPGRRHGAPPAHRLL